MALSHIHERRLIDLERRLDSLQRQGTIYDVKASEPPSNGSGQGAASPGKRWYVRVQDGEGENRTFKTDWIPWQSFSHSTITLSMPPRKLMKVSVHAPNGDSEMSYATPYHSGPDTPLPSDKPDEMVLHIKGEGSSPSPDGSDPHVRIHHTKDDTTTSTSGVTRKTKQTDIAEAAVKTMTRNTGTKDVDEAASTGGGNLPHELNRQMQGIRATLTQHDHHIAALHDTMSNLNNIAQGMIPELAMLNPFLSNDPKNLKHAADAVMPRLEQYVSFSMQQAIDKMSNGFLSNVMSIATGGFSGDLQGIIGRTAALAAGSGLASKAADTIDIAMNLVPSAAGGNGDLLHAAFGSLGMLFGGTPAAGAFAGLLGELGGVIGSSASIMPSLGGMRDSQQNIVVGMTKSYRLGGYGAS